MSIHELFQLLLPWSHISVLVYAIDKGNAPDILDMADSLSPPLKSLNAIIRVYRLHVIRIIFGRVAAIVVPHPS